METSTERFIKSGITGIVEFTQVNIYIDTALNLAIKTGDFAIMKCAIKNLRV